MNVKTSPAKNQNLTEPVLDLAICSKSAGILWEIRQRRKWNDFPSHPFGCEFKSSDILKSPCRSKIPEVSAIYWMIELMADSGDSRGEADRIANALNTLDTKDIDSNAAAMRLVSRHLKNQELFLGSSFCRLDRTKDASKSPGKGRLLRWVLSCLRVFHPVLFSLPILVDKSDDSMIPVVDPAQFKCKSDQVLLTRVPAVAYESSPLDTTGTKGQRCFDKRIINGRLFLPNQESILRTIPSHCFRGCIQDCWILIHPDWLSLIDLLKPENSNRSFHF